MVTQRCEPLQEDGIKEDVLAKLLNLNVVSSYGLIKNQELEKVIILDTSVLQILRELNITWANFHEKYNYMRWPLKMQDLIRILDVPTMENVLKSKLSLLSHIIHRSAPSRWYIP